MFLIAVCLVTLCLSAGSAVASDGTTLVDAFEDISAWSAHPADGVDLELSGDEGAQGGALRLDFRFGGGGYAVARREVSLDLPENYAFRFLIRGETPPNTLEFKLLDASGENVWWFVRRDFEFPRDWESFTIRSRQITFAWGPAGGGEIRHVAAIEIVVTAGSGGQGTVWVDDLQLVALQPRDAEPPMPVARASSEQEAGSASLVLDGDTATAWEPAREDVSPWIELDFGGSREYGGVVLDWVLGRHPRAYVLETAPEPGIGARVLYRVEGNGGRDYIYLPETESRTLRVRVLSDTEVEVGLHSDLDGDPSLDRDPDSDRDPARVPAAEPTVALAEFSVRPLEFSATRAVFFEAIASDSPRGVYPRGMSGEQPYWTVVGVDADPKDGLLSEDGALEVERAGFSVEPFLRLVSMGQGNGAEASIPGKLIGWADVETEQALERGYLPIPSVIWRLPEAGGAAPRLTITAFGLGEPGASSIAARYRVDNDGPAAAHATLYLAIRPFQVNPPAQFLNQPGGTARIDALTYHENRVRVNDRTDVISFTPPDAFGAATFDAGDIVAEYLSTGRLPVSSSAVDSFGAASGALVYNLEIPPGESREVALLIPLYSAAAPADSGKTLAVAEHGVAEDWVHRLRVGAIEIEVPREADLLVESARAQLGWILVNRAGPAIQPGTRSYARSWIRDGALTSSALLRMGLAEPAREFLEWYAPHQYANGKIPCVVDARGADPVPEHDSSGEFIFLVAECHRFIGDRDLTARMWPRVLAAADYLDSLRRERRTPEYRQPGMEPFFGILPPSISHEGYSAKPMHSYWDDFWAFRGFKDAVALAEELGHDGERDRLMEITEEFAKDLSASIEAAMRAHAIDYVPGCADLGDFDATSTTIALSPAEAQDLLPDGAAERTFERYWEFFAARRDGAPWEAYTPYEIRNVGAFVRLGWRERAHELLTYFLEHQRPASWRQWPEVVWNDARRPRFLGDLPHTWVGSDYVRSFLDLFVYEREADEALVLAAGVPARWLAPPAPSREPSQPSEDSGVRVRNLPTRYGPISYSLARDGDAIEIRIDDGVTVPPGGIVVMLPAGTADIRPGTPDARAPILVRTVPAVLRVEG